MTRVRECLVGYFGYFVAALLLLSYVIAALEPFHWNPPRRIDNGAAITEQGAIHFSSPGLARTTAAAKWLDRAIQLNALGIRLRVRSFSRQQSGPARIFTISANPDLRNLTIAQEESDLVIRLRTPDTSFNGIPAFVIPGVFDTSAWHDVALTVRPGAITLTLDGESALSERLPKKPLMNWDRGFRVALGNELTGRRPWLGEVSRATVLVDDREIDYLRHGELEVPTHYWAGLRFQLVPPLADVTQRHEVVRDTVLNFLCFIPFGFVLAMLRGQRGSFVFAFFACAIASLSVEAAQVCFEGRTPSATDWGSNVLGAAVGAWAARRLVAGTRRQKSDRRSMVAA